MTTGCDKQPPTVTVGNDTGPAGLAVNHSTDTIYVDNTADDTVSVINGAACNGNNTSGCGHRPRRVAVGRQYFGCVAVDPSTDLAYATDYFDDAVSVINGATCTASNTGGCDQIPPTVAVAASPVGLAVAPGNHNVYVADNGGGPVRSSASRRPGAPSRVTASLYNGEAEIVWQPSTDGGLPIIYHVIPTPACPPCTGLNTPSTSGAPCTTINGLTPGQTYTFKIRATNADGAGPTSTTSNAITP